MHSLVPRPDLLTRHLTVASRRLRRAPWYSATVVGTTALTMAVATTVFTIVDGVLFKPLPYERAGELFHVSGGYSDELRAQHPKGVSNRFGLGMAVLDARELEAAVPGVRVAVFSGAAAQQRHGDLRAWTPAAASIDRHLLEVLGVSPLIGGLTDDDFDAAPDAARAAVLTYRAWQARFGGRTGIVGEIIEGATPAQRYRVAGVLPEAFLHPTSGAQPDLVTPILATPDDPATRRRVYTAVARVPPQVPAADAQARFNEVARAAREVIPDRQLNGGMGPWDEWAMRPLPAVLAGQQQPTFQYVFLAAMALVLLGCINVSGLVASRGLDRSREISLRRALGAGRRDIAALVVSELALLLAAGSLLGVLASRPAVSLAVSLLPPNAGLLREPALDLRVLAFAAAATVLSVALVSLWPLRQTRRATAVSTVGGTALTSTAPQAGRFVLVGLQVMLGFSLTLAGALIVGNLARIWQTDVGYPTERLLVIDGAAVGADASGRLAGLDAFLDAVRRIPGVTDGGATGAGLLRGGMPGGMWPANTYAVTEGFFDAIPIRVIEGRLPTNDELRARVPVAAINDAMAAQYFPDRPAVGQILREEGGNRTAFTVVGVVEYARYGAWIESPVHGQVYIPLADARRFSAAVRTAASAGPVLERMLDAARESRVELATAASADSLLRETVRAQRFQGWLFGAFAAGALVVMCVGVLGLMATTTARRTRELAIRLALGARPASIPRLMLREHLVPVAAGLLAGGLVSIWVAASLRRYLYETAPYDPTIWTLAAAAIIAAAALGILIPAQRATRVDPARVLRAE